MIQSDDPSTARTGALPDAIIGRRASEIKPKPRETLTRPHEVRVVSRHNCYRTHRSFARFAGCTWRKAVWVNGEGEWATVSCGGTTVLLHRTEAEARQALRGIDAGSCGHACKNDHELVQLVVQ